MKTIIAGSRDITDYEELKRAVASCGWDVTTVVSGAAHGVDRLGEIYAIEMGLPLELYPAHWNTHGRSAGYIRNGLMASRADALIAIWDGSSKGTKHMIDIANKKALKVYVHMLKERNNAT